MFIVYIILKGDREELKINRELEKKKKKMPLLLLTSEPEINLVWELITYYLENN